MADTTQQAVARPWRFFRAGGFDQVLLDSGQDILALASLDQKLWVALSCPTSGVEFDARTLELIDTDHDGHIRVPEILAALAWLNLVLRNPETLLPDGADGVPLAAINDQTEEGRRVLASARTLLLNLGKGDMARITVEDACECERVFIQTGFNGDGVVTEASAEDESLRSWIAELIGCYGGETDRNGEPGINREMVERFSADLQAWLAWKKAGDDLCCASENRAALLELWLGVKGKIEDYFLRCRLAAYDERATVVMNSAEADLTALAARNLAEANDEIAALPLSAVNPDQMLDLERGVNPAWQGRVEQFQREIVRSLLGATDQVSAADWETIKARMAPWEAWWDGRSGSLPAVDPARAREWEERGVAEALLKLIEQDQILEPEAEAMIEVEKLTRFCRDMYPLVNNFVSFREFYTNRGKGIFQAGTLYLDGRSFDLCVPVADITKHASLAVLSRVFLVYCDCVRGGGTERMTIAAAVTNGDADQLIVGRNGVFYDRKGVDWDATVVRVIEHPISIRQSFWEPYKRLGRMVSEQIQKVSAARSRAAEEKRTLALMQVGQKKEDPKVAAQQQAFDAAKFAGIFAAIGLAIGAIGTALATVVTGFFRLAWWQMPLAIAGILLVVSGPSVIIAVFKLRQRNLGPLLDANGWAVNARAKLNIPFGASLTGMARLPQGATQFLSDPYAEKRTPWKLYLILLIVALVAVMAWRGGWLRVCFVD